MRTRTGRVVSIIAGITAVMISVRCAVPRRIWSGKDIVATELHDPSAGARVLVASLTSEFKDAVIARIMETFKDEPVYIKFTGLAALDGEDADLYDAVVVINRCIAWGMSPRAEAFVDLYGDRDNLIVLTTSGDGDWKPAHEGRRFDAIATASVKEDVNIVADKISSRIRALVSRPAS